MTEVDDLVARVKVLEQQVASLERRAPADRVTIVVSSREFDRVMTAFVLAAAAAAMGSEVVMFFALWGITVLKKKSRLRRKTVTDKVLAAVLPAGVGGTSQMNMFGAGPLFFRHLMKKRKIQNIEELMAVCQEVGVRMTACSMSMELMGVGADELVETADVGGAAVCLAAATDSKATLFIG